MSRKLIIAFAAAAGLMGCRAHARVGSVHAGGGIGQTDTKRPEQVAQRPTPDPAPVNAQPSR